MEKRIEFSIKDATQAEFLANVFEKILEDSELQVWIKDAELRYLYANENMKIADGIVGKKVVGKTDSELYETLRGSMFLKLDHNAIEKKEKVSSNYVLPSGRFEEVTKVPIYNKDGELQGILGFAKDITNERLLAEQTKRTTEAEGQFRTVFENVPVGIAVYDKSTGKPIMMNDRFAQLLRLPKDTLSRTEWGKFFYDSEGAREVYHLIRDLTQGKRKGFEIEQQLLRGDDSLVWVSISMTTYLSTSSDETLYLCMLEDISERKQMKANLEKLSYTDALTGVYSRSWLLRVLKNIPEVEFPFALVMGDVNGLKVCNDVFGHFEGDKLIKAVASVFKFYTSKYDDSFTVRLGGDEFLAVIHGVSEQELEQLEIDIKNDVAELSTEYMDYSVGLGSVIVTEDAFVDLESAMLAAEEKMYNNKLVEGRNLGDRVVERAIALLYKDPLESSHMRNVAAYSEKIGEYLNLRRTEINDIVEAARLHDIGISGCSAMRESPGTPIMEKDSKHTNIIRKHAEVGYRMLHYSKNYSNLAEYVLHHHENVDGTGYPSGIGADDIPKASRIVSIADNYDYYVNPYFGQNLNQEQVIAKLRELEGTELDYEYTELFIEEYIKKSGTKGI